MPHQYIAVLRIPTTQYAYIEIHHKGTIPELVEAYNEATRAAKVGVGLEQKEWNIAIDHYRKGNGMDVEAHEKMNAAQRWLIAELDRSDNRLKYQESKTLKTKTE